MMPVQVLWIILQAELQSGNDPLALAEWFAASVALVVVVTLLYVFVLSKSAPPETLTEAKLESSRDSTYEADRSETLLKAQNALIGGEYSGAVDLSVKAASLTLSSALRSAHVETSNMNISDMSYIVQNKSMVPSDITRPIYQLNLLHLRSAQGEQITKEEAEWAVSTTGWLNQLLATQRVGS